MKKVEKISAAKNFTAANVGKLKEVVNYLFPLGPGR